MSLLCQRVVHLKPLIVNSIHPPLAVPNSVLVVPVRQKMMRTSSKSTQLSSTQQEVAKDILLVRNQGLEVDDNEVEPKISKKEMRFHFKLISFQDRCRDGMVSTNMSLSFRWKKVQVLREIRHQLVKVGARFFSSYFRLCGCLIVLWRQHHMKSSRVRVKHCKNVGSSVLLEFGSSCWHTAAGKRMTLGTQNPSTQGGIHVRINLPPLWHACLYQFASSWHSTASTKSILGSVSTSMTHQLIVIDFGRNVKWFGGGMQICGHFLPSHGFCVLMNTCQFGFRGGPILDRCFVHANPTHLVMNTTLNAVACLVWCFPSSWLREKIDQMNWDLQSMMITEVRQWAYYCICWRVYFTLVHTLCLTVDSASIKPLLSWGESFFTGALIEKRCHWSTLVPGVLILEYFQDRAVGFVDAVSGFFYGIKYNIWCMKEPEYVMQIMATGGALSKVGGKEVKRFWRLGEMIIMLLLTTQSHLNGILNFDIQAMTSTTFDMPYQASRECGIPTNGPSESSNSFLPSHRYQHLPCHPPFCLQV